ncbi:hypothetical protein LCGC14_2977030, partial [marine sediment metagenome]
DWRFVQAVWAQVNSYWPAIAAKQKREVEAALAKELGHAEIELQGAMSDHEKAEKRHAAAADTLEKALADVVDLDKATCHLAEAKTARESAETAVRDADRTRTELKTRVDDLEEKARKLEPLRADLRTRETSLGTWNLLEEALGKNGIQAMEIDAAGPEVARIANELLESCYGPRFSIQFETLREKKSKAGEFSEAFDIHIFDNGIPKLVEVLSGGEKTIVGEAVGLALAIYNARKSGVRWKTLFRDETTGALDPDNANQYVLMLRRAMALGSFDQCVFVAHLPQVYEAADVRLYVADGRISTRKEAA